MSNSSFENMAKLKKKVEYLKKLKNRKERIEFIIKKLGIGTAQGMLLLSDKEIKKFVDSIYIRLKDKNDYQEKESTCLRCGEEIIHHTECGCGYNRAVFSEWDWKDDIESFDEEDRCPQDKEFIENGYKV